MSSGIAHRIFSLAEERGGKIKIYANGNRMTLAQLEAPHSEGSSQFYSARNKPMVVVTGSKGPVDNGLQREASAIKASYSFGSQQHTISFEKASDRDLTLVLLHLKQEEARRADDLKGLKAWSDEIAGVHKRSHAKA